MSADLDRIEARFFTRWWRATFLGWFVGFAIVVILALCWDLFGGGAQFMVGVGMGAGVGYLQGRVLKTPLASAWQWWVTSAVGMGTPFILHDLLGLGGVHFPFSVPIYVVVGGLIVGLLQWRLLHRISSRAGWWVPACVVAWGIPAGAIAMGEVDGLQPWGQLISVIGMICGGIVVGAVGGATMVWMVEGTAMGSREEKSPELEDPLRAVPRVAGECSKHEL